MFDISYDWSWTEAFNKYGFNEGETDTYTFEVSDFLADLGYIIETTSGIHNTYISSLRSPTGVELLAVNKFNVGIDDAEEQLPDVLVDALNQKFGPATD